MPNDTQTKTQAEQERDLLAKAMWLVRAQFGFDTDGDDRYHSTDYRQITESFRADMDAVAIDHAEALCEAEANLAALQKRVGALADEYETAASAAMRDGVKSGDREVQFALGAVGDLRSLTPEVSR